MAHERGRAAISKNTLMSSPGAAPRLLNQLHNDSERTRHLCFVFQLLAKCVCQLVAKYSLLTLWNELQCCKNRYNPLDKSVPVLVLDKPDTDRTGVPLRPLKVVWIGAKALCASAEIAWSELG